MIGERTPNLDRKYPRPEKLENGRRLCRVCGKLTPAGMISYCSQPCRDTGYLYSRYEAMKEFIYRRDCKRCQLCNCDLGKLARIFRFVRRGIQNEVKRVLGFDTHVYVLYHIDHVLPVVLGGLCEPENLRTLCHECHKRESKKLAGLLVEIGKALGL